MSEVKYHDVRDYMIPGSNAGSFTKLNVVPIGTGRGDRIGCSINCKKVHIKYRHLHPGIPFYTGFVRLEILIDTQPQHGPPATADYLNDPSVTSFQNPASFARFLSVYKWIGYIKYDSSGHDHPIFHERAVDIDGLVTQYALDDYAGTSQTFGTIYCFCITNTGVDVPVANAYISSRLEYTD